MPQTAGILVYLCQVQFFLDEWQGTIIGCRYQGNQTAELCALNFVIWKWNQKQKKSWESSDRLTRGGAAGGESGRRKEKARGAGGLDYKQLKLL